MRRSKMIKEISYILSYMKHNPDRSLEKWAEDILTMQEKEGMVSPKIPIHFLTKNSFLNSYKWEDEE